MLYDYYAAFSVQEREGNREEKREKERENIDDLVRGKGKYAEINDLRARTALLVTALGIDSKLPDARSRPDRIDPKAYARTGEGQSPSGLKTVMHSGGSYNSYIACRLAELDLLGIDSHADLHGLPEGSWSLELPLTLASPFYSRDDIPFYIIDNPLRVDKVFGVPYTAAPAWKGSLRWAMMKEHLEPVKKNPEQFARRRLQHCLLFGTEKGLESNPSGWSAHLDRLGGKEAQDTFRRQLRDFFSAGKSPRKDEETAHTAGMLHFFPTFWDRVEMAVLNPHDRQYKTGKNPIYYEVAPRGARGMFRLLYVPLYHLEETQNKKRNYEAICDLRAVAAALEPLLLQYGFSAKKSLGWGVVEDSWEQSRGNLCLQGHDSPICFGSFPELKEKVNSLLQEVG